MKALLTLIFVLLAGTAYGRDGFPECPSEYSKPIERNLRSNCYGSSSSNWPEDFYEGELDRGILNGQGVKVFQNGDIKIGQWISGSLNGLGIFYSKDKKILAEGLWKYGQLVEPKKIDPYKFTHIERSTLERLGISYLSGEVINENLTTQNGQSNLPACQGSRWTNCFGSLTYSNGDKYVGEWKDGNRSGQGTYTFANGANYVGEFKDGKFHGQGKFINQFRTQFEGSFRDGERLVGGTTVNLPSQNTEDANNTEGSDFEVERQRLAGERRKLDEDKRQSELARQSKRISINVSATQPDSSGVVTINIQTNTDTSSLKINGEELGGKADGIYSVKKVARVGQDTKFTIAGVDVNGNTDTKTISVSRTVVESKVTYQQLNPDRVKRQPERDAVAVIIGISNYKSLPKAEFAKDDAQVFYDYAIRALGVKPGNIKLLMDEQADAEEIYAAFKTWLPARVKSTTDVYVFYSGHGLPTQDGLGLYWLPQRANRDVISKTAILLQDINTDIQASKPKSVTIFMDACYSGQARGGETLVASARPIALKSQPTTFPSNFTVISASQADQISSSSPELQHGIFSYYLMRGMEGEADLNKDGKITLNETQAYLSENVGRQARIMNRQQEPQVIGDGSRVLVGR